MRMHEWRVRGCIAGKKQATCRHVCLRVFCGIANGVQNHSGSLNVKIRANSPRDLCVPYCLNQYSHVVHQRSLGKHCKVIEADSRAGLFT